MRDLMDEIRLRDAQWDRASEVERVEIRAVYRDAGWKSCGHEGCPPHNCRNPLPKPTPIVKGQFTVGQELRVWSERVFGVPVAFTVSKVGRTRLHGTFRYGGSEWSGSVPAGRVVDLFGRDD